MEVAFDSDSGETSTFLNREAVVSESHDGRYKRVARYKYNELFSPKFTFVKKNFGDFSRDDVRKVLKWLTSTDTTAMLDVYYDHADDSKTVDWSAIGGWTEISTYKLGNNRTVGIVATFESVTPYAMSMPEPKTYIVNGVDNKIEIDIDTDDNKPIYPKITINHNYKESDNSPAAPHSKIKVPAGTITEQTDMIPNTVYTDNSMYYWKSPEITSGTTGPDYNWETVERDGDYTNKDVIEANKIYHYKKPGKYYWIDPFYFHSSSNPPSLETTGVRIKNTHAEMGTREAVMVKNNTNTEAVVIDGANKIISSSSTRRIFGDDFNRVWLELYDGKNEITIEGNCEVTIEWREVRKVGEW
jgi:hypothetical protein